jgi:hypothetical protein
VDPVTEKLRASKGAFGIKKSEIGLSCWK